MNQKRQSQDVNKSERVYGRVSKHELQKITEAANRDRRSRSGFVAKAAVEKAQEVLHDEDTTSN